MASIDVIQPTKELEQKQRAANGETKYVDDPAPVEAEVQQSTESDHLAEKVEEVKLGDAPSASGGEEVKEAAEQGQPAEQREEKQDCQASEASAKEEAVPALDPAETAIEPQPVQEGEKVEAA